MGIFSAASDDILQNILFRLPASSFASAACVNKSWNKVCNRVLSCPKLMSALFLNPSLYVRWDMIPEEDGSVSQESQQFNRDIVLILGYLPGLKVDAIPLLRSKMGHRVAMVDRFMMDIKNYTAHVSGTVVPSGIIVFGDQHIDLNPVLAEIGKLIYVHITLL